MTSRGYLLPTEPDTDQFSCIKVFYPAKDEYLRALIGSLSYLATWMAWERDENKGGKIAASLWKDALDFTIDALSDGCESDCEMTEDELRIIISEELEKMTINVTQTVNCGCCGGQTTTTTTTDDEPPEGYDITPIDVTAPEDEVQATDRCDRVNYLLVQYRTACLVAQENFLEPFTTVTSWWDSVVGWLAGYTPLSYDTYLIVKQWVISSSTLTPSAFTTPFDQNFDSMVCAAFSAATPNASKTAVRDILENYVWSELDSFQRLIMREIFERLPFDLLFDATIDADLPPGFIGRECCGSVPTNDVLGLWEVEMTGLVESYCELGSIDVTLDNQNQYMADVVLAKNQQYTGYAFEVFRQTPFADATYFNLTLEVSGDIGAWTIQFLNSSDAVVHETVESSAPLQPWSFDNGVDFDFSLVSKVVVKRKDEIYTASCPRTFGIDFSIETDSDDWLVY